MRKNFRFTYTFHKRHCITLSRHLAERSCRILMTVLGLDSKQLEKPDKIPAGLFVMWHPNDGCQIFFACPEGWLKLSSQRLCDQTVSRVWPALSFWKNSASIIWRLGFMKADEITPQKATSKTPKLQKIKIIFCVKEKSFGTSCSIKYQNWLKWIQIWDVYYKVKFWTCSYVKPFLYFLYCVKPTLMGMKALTFSFMISNRKWANRQLSRRAKYNKINQGRASRLDKG